MLKELLEAISAQVRMAEAIQIVHPPAEPDHVYLVKNSEAEGDFKRIEAAAPNEDHKALCLGTLCAHAILAADFGGQIWYSRSGVVALTSEDKRQRCSLLLSFSEPLKQLQAWQANPLAVAQKDLVLTLRHKFRLCHDPALLTAVRAVNWNLGEAGESEVQHGKQSLGKKIIAEVSGKTAIPEDTIFNVPVWEGLAAGAIAFPVGAAIEPVPSAQAFKIMPFPGQVEAAIAAAEDVLGKRLHDIVGDKVPVYYGTPE
jgi:hypothetical protein